MSTNLDHLYAAKIRKLKEQKSFSDQMNDHLSKNGGLNDSSKVAVKNLHAAIAVSKKPGYFEYYVANDDIKRTEEKKMLNALARSVQKTHKELEQINEEIALAESHQHAQKLQQQQLAESSRGINSMSQWFDTYGRPTLTEEKKERMTSFSTNSKIYGGTQHYKSFKTVSTVMTKGRITR
jgi:hypothetical protein